MNSKIIFDHIRTKLGETQSQYDALLRLLNNGAKVEDIAIFVGLGIEQAEKPVIQEKGKWQLSQRSIDRMSGVHPDLVKVVKRAIELSEYDFMVVEGLRTIETQKEYVKKGVSKTMNSRHLRQSDGFGHAVDLAPLENGAIDWKNSKGQFDSVSKAMKQASRELGVEIEWGGDWKSFVDKPHFQVPR